MARSLLVPASYVFLLRDGAAGPEVLLHLRRATGYLDGHWASLAGHVEDGETAVAAAVREVREEAGVDVDPADLVPLTTVHRTTPGGGQRDQRVDFFFTARRWRGEPRVAEPAKNAGLAWFPLTDLPQPVQPQEAQVLAELRSGARVPALLIA
ncbi:ADP-ribose pyrophosphatase YjhB, NUDIX family [Modestobacter sp. DSM 44400]|uniref:NUDIX hydrolase n=1 Tax=Modestobacter sp. DSM 44400 TaxID=1550230 RepID=UPI00089A2037|nr:NUDIX domain-containing protein [Modestobacter sp. DSM 44400]SDX79406.1 ADP-ribose pyrophosphatase YjhB, NUDIX family [Modestobacter sp. DSM 44400]